MLAMFHATLLSNITYAASAWMPYLSQSRIDDLERLQNRGLRLVSGQLRTTPVEALRAEVGVPSIATRRKRIVASSYEKAMRLDVDHPRRVAADGVARHRTVRGSWRQVSRDLQERLPPELQQREPLRLAPAPPWSYDHPRGWSVRLRLPGGITRNSSQQAKLQAAITSINSADVDHVIYTDGSAAGGIGGGGSAAVVTTGTATDFAVVEVLRSRGRAFTSSFEEERDGLLSAAVWIRGSNTTSVLICSDSQSALTALEHDSPEMYEVRRLLDECEGYLTVDPGALQHPR